MRLIDADSLMAEWEEPRDWLDRDQVLRHYTWFKVVIESQPTIEAVPERKGRWIVRDNPGTGWYRVTCSECGEDVTSTIPMIGFFPDAKPLWDYCPNCGASMTEGAEDAGRDE